MSDLISRADAIEAIASRDETDGTVKAFTGREVNGILSALPSADRPIGWIPISDIRKLQDILYLHIDSLEGTRNIVEAGMLSAWKEVVEYLDGMLGEDGE